MMIAGCRSQWRLVNLFRQAAVWTGFSEGVKQGRGKPCQRFPGGRCGDNWCGTGQAASDEQAPDLDQAHHTDGQCRAAGGGNASVALLLVWPGPKLGSAKKI